jgi:hypothetical protein
MKFQFDAHLPHQSSAINAVLGIFEGSQATDGRDYATAMQTFDTALFQGVVQTAHGIGNAGLKMDGLLLRVQAVQEANGIEPSKGLVNYYGDPEDRQCRAPSRW